MPDAEYGEQPEKRKAWATIGKIVAQALGVLAASGLADAVRELADWLAN